MFLYIDVRHIESDVVCDIAMRSYVTSYTTNVLTTRVVFLFIYPTGRIRVCKDKICHHWWKSRKTLSGVQEIHILSSVRREKSVPRDHCLTSPDRASWCQTVTLGRIFLSAPHIHEIFLWSCDFLASIEYHFQKVFIVTAVGLPAG